MESEVSLVMVEFRESVPTGWVKGREEVKDPQCPASCLPSLRKTTRVSSLRLNNVNKPVEADAA